jgi:hypothetical protein
MRAWLILAVVCSALTFALPARAADAAPRPTPAAASAPLAAWYQDILHNRSRVVQFAVGGMILAIFVLTRGPRKY